MKSFRISIAKDGKLSISCPECGSTKVEVTNYPANEVDKIKCRQCGNTIYRQFPQPKDYHQVTIDELDEKDDGDYKAQQFTREIEKTNGVGVLR